MRLLIAHSSRVHPSLHPKKVVKHTTPKEAVEVKEPEAENWQG